MEPQPVPEHLRDAAQAVIEHLVALRGGGLLLSGVDGALLVDWLESGVSPALIALALERVADRRRKRRVKSRLSLRACKTEVKRLGSKGLSASPAALPAAPVAPPAPSTSGGGALEALEVEALAALDALPGGDTATVAEAAMAVVRRFHSRAWAAAEPEHGALKEQAAEELVDFRAGMDPLHWEEAVEEAARDLLRQRFPRLSAVAVWDRLHAS
jgi:hypothetical protein